MRLTPLASLWTCWLLVALLPIAGHIGVARVSPLLFAWLGSFAGFCWFLPWIIRNNVWPKFVDPRIAWRLAGIGAFGNAFPYIVLLIALRYTTPANAAILAQIEIVYCIILARIFLGERPSLSQFGGTFLVLFGTLLIVFHERFSPRWTGDLLILGMPWMYQVSHVLAKKLPADCSPKFIAAARALFGFMVLTPIAAVGFVVSPFNFTFDIPAVVSVVFFGFIIMGFNNILWYNAIRNMDLAKASAIILSYPVLTTAVSWLAGLESLKSYQFIGLACAMAGAYWVTLLVKKSSPKRSSHNA